MALDLPVSCYLKALRTLGNFSVAEKPCQRFLMLDDIPIARTVLADKFSITERLRSGRSTENLGGNFWLTAEFLGARDFSCACRPCELSLINSTAQ